MGYAPDGTYTPTNTSVEGHVADITSTNSPLMRSAAASGIATANKRGLLNSTMAVQGSQQAVINSAVPMAAQDSAQENQANLESQSTASTEKVAGMNIAANDRQQATAAAVSMSQIYSNMFTGIASDTNIPAATRTGYLNSISALRDTNLNLVEQLYNVDLHWASATPFDSKTGLPTS